MNPGFEFKLLWSDADVLEVRVYASNVKFCGTADVYVPVGGLAEAAATLHGFPATISDQRELQLGEFGPQTAGGAIRMRFYCIGAAGRTLVATSIESDHRDQTGAETASFVAALEANAVDVFVSELRSMESERCGTACLNILVTA